MADSARAILDGHFVLSRTLAEQGHYPALDIEASISRAMPQIVDNSQLNLALQFKRLYSRYQQNADLISVGAYARGSDPETDRAVDMLPAIRAYLQQGMDEPMPMQRSVQELAMVMSPPPQPKNQPGQPQTLRRTP